MLASFFEPVGHSFTGFWVQKTKKFNYERFKKAKLSCHMHLIKKISSNMKIIPTYGRFY